MCLPHLVMLLNLTFAVLMEVLSPEVVGAHYPTKFYRQQVPVSELDVAYNYEGSKILTTMRKRYHSYQVLC